MKNTVKWYLKPVAVIIAILCAGPFALPLLWLSPEFKKWHKALITVLVAALTIWTLISAASLYKTLLGQMQDLREIMQ